MSTLMLPRLLSETVRVEPVQEVSGTTVQDALDDLLTRVPGLRAHILDEAAAIRPHVSVFVDGEQAELATEVGPTSEIRVLQAVSGG
ncbi:MAG TPA: MoaD/ThiS family protein [Acidimicrobiia bacterium]|nr:MoaD/ThiS family protein [Acidimicrobiia bacterium]